MWSSPRESAQPWLYSSWRRNILFQLAEETGEVLERLEMPPIRSFRVSSPMAAISSSVEEEGAGR